jgi:hypothetical protein
MSTRLAKGIRICTIAPVMAALLLAVLRARRPAVFGAGPSFALALLFLTVLPVLAYPLQPLFPHYRSRGREGQRDLAIVFAVAGYLLGCLCSLVLSAPRAMWVIYLEYLLSGCCIFFCSGVLHKKASGHACGIAGPFALLQYFGIHAWLPGAIVLALVLWASLRTKRHTWQQFLAGAAIPVAVLCVLRLAFGLC